MKCLSPELLEYKVHPNHPSILIKIQILPGDPDDMNPSTYTFWEAGVERALVYTHIHMFCSSIIIKRIFMEEEVVMTYISCSWTLLHIRINCGEGNGTPLQYSCLKIPWTEEPGRLQSMGSLRLGHDWVTSLSFFTFMHWRRKWQPTPVFLPGESQGQRSLVGCRLWGHTESDTTEAMQQQQQNQLGGIENSQKPTHT